MISAAEQHDVGCLQHTLKLRTHANCLYFASLTLSLQPMSPQCCVRAVCWQYREASGGASDLDDGRCQTSSARYDRCSSTYEVLVYGYVTAVCHVQRETRRHKCAASPPMSVEDPKGLLLLSREFNTLVVHSVRRKKEVP